MNGSCCTPRNGLARPSVVAVPAFGSFFADVLSDPFFAPLAGAREGVATAARALPIDVVEEASALIVRAQVPGVAKEQIEVQLEDGVLSLAVNACECTETTGRVHRQEIRCTAMGRKIRLPFAVVEDQIKGELRDGILTLTLPKVPEAQARKIQING